MKRRERARLAVQSSGNEYVITPAAYPGRTYVFSHDTISDKTYVDTLIFRYHAAKRVVQIMKLREIYIKKIYKRNPSDCATFMVIVYIKLES